MELIRKPDSRDGIYKITPVDAAMMIEKIKKNRPLSERDAQAIAKDIVARKWICNGETIILNGDGTPLDGQHRLRGCVIANKPIESYVVFGFDSGAAEFDTLDQGKGRSTSDRFALDGIPNYSMQAAVARLSLRYRTMVEKNSERLPVDTRIAVHLLRTERNSLDPRIGRSCSEVSKLSPKFKKLVPITLVAFVHMKAGDIDSGKAEKFLFSLATGEGLSASNPVLALRTNLISRASAQTRTKSNVFLAMLIKTWNYYSAQKSVKQIAWKDTEPFPHFNS